MRYPHTSIYAGELALNAFLDTGTVHKRSWQMNWARDHAGRMQRAKAPSQLVAAGHKEQETTPNAVEASVSLLDSSDSKMPMDNTSVSQAIGQVQVAAPASRLEFN